MAKKKIDKVTAESIGTVNGDTVLLERKTGLPADLAPVQSEGLTIAGFVNGLVPFFQTAGQLEQQAQQTLATAKTWQRPTTLDEDAALVEAVKAVKAQRKTLEQHWSARSIFHSFHKKLVAAFDRANAPLEEAERIGNRLHNEHVEAERLRVQREADEKRRIAEAAERERQQAEAARLEQEAEAAEAASADLSERERNFVRYVVAGADDGRAANLAGFKNPAAKGAQLRTYTKINEAIAAGIEAKVLREQAEAVKAQPVAIEAVEVETKAQVATEGRTTYAAEIVNAEQFVAAALTGAHGIPADCLMPNPVKLNEYARSMHERINRWPGITLKKTTKL